MPTSLEDSRRGSEPQTNLEIFPPIFNEISGQRIENALVSLAQIGGRQIDGSTMLPIRYATNRLALSPPDLDGRRHLADQISKANIAAVITVYAFGTVFTFSGTDEQLPPLIIISHTDTVPEGGMYDGTVGVISALEAMRAIKKTGINLNRTVKVVAFTGEESAGFNRALFGSAAAFKGLTDADLDSHRENQPTIREALVQAGFNPITTRTPVFTKDKTYAVLELHVDQTGRLEKEGNDLGFVETIAAAKRYKIVLDQPSQTDSEHLPTKHYFDLNVYGKTGHSGATPMGLEYRADGLVITADILLRLTSLQNELGDKVRINIGGVAVASQALNKIPGVTITSIMIEGRNEQEIIDTQSKIGQILRKIAGRTILKDEPAESTVELKQAPLPNEDGFIRIGSVGLQTALRIIKAVKIISGLPDNKKHHVVGTVGTFNVNEKGQIVLGIDIRGIDEKRDNALDSILEIIGKTAQECSCRADITLLPGGSNPVTMSAKLLERAEQVNSNNRIGKATRTVSSAGHDSMNAAEAGIPTGLVFIPSAGEIAHTPDEYTSPEDLERGAKMLATLIYDLSTRHMPLIQ